MSGDLSGFSLMELFRTEAEAQLAVLSEGVLALEERGGSGTAVEPLMRAAHSLKGAARIVGLTGAERLAHALEDVFVAAQQDRLRLRPHHVDHLLAALDLLGELARRDEAALSEVSAGDDERLGAIVETLRAIAADRFAEPVSPAPAASATPEPARDQPTTPGDTGPEQADSNPPSPQFEARPGLPEPPALDVAPPRESSAPTPSSGTVAAPTGAVGSALEARPGAAGPEAADRVVRVTAESLNRLLGLAGAGLIEARQLRAVVDSLGTLRRLQAALWETLQALEERPLAQGADHDRAPLVRARSQATRCLELLAGGFESLEAHARRGADLAERLHQEVLSSRLRPFSDGVRGFPRLVRDLARQLGKQARLEVIGEQTGVDRDILERLEAPLNHLVRNALDHGIEPPEQRRAAGKAPTATIRLEARHVAGMLQVSLADDGRGIDIAALRRRVVERGLVEAAVADGLTEAELLEFLFLPGFSTRAEVNEVSGRGVGLDVVQSMAQAVGGGVRVASRAGQGTQFRLQLPITMSVLRALLVTVGGEPYAFPLPRLDRVVDVGPDAIEMIEGRRFFTIDDQRIGLVGAAQVLERPGGVVDGSALPVVVISDRGHCFGVVVEEVLGERDLDVRPLDARLGKVPNVNSASVLEDGHPVLILDVEDLVRSIDNLLTGRRLRLPMAEPGTAAAAQTVRRVLVVDDSITVRELERQLLEGRGYAVDVAVDGMDGWNAVRSGHYDLVVSDVDMPRMDGIALVRQIRQDPRFAGLPVVIVSYKDRAEDRLRGLDAGANSYLTKSSFHDETFLETVVDLIGEATGP